MPSYARLLAARVTDGLSGAVSNAPSLPATEEFQTLRGGGEPRRVAFSFSVAQCTEHARGTWQSGEFTIVRVHNCERVHKAFAHIARVGASCTE